MKLRVIYELLESITDRCEDVANVIEGIVLEKLLMYRGGRDAQTRLWIVIALVLVALRSTS
jgi:hypothetical protein